MSKKEYLTEISDNNAKKINDMYFNDFKSHRLISVVGSWGSGKSTVKTRLKDIIREKDKNILIVDFEARQFEENSQVTSELYNAIGKIFSRFRVITRNNFFAIAQLKKESSMQSLSISQVWTVVILGLLTYVLTKMVAIYNLSDLLNYVLSKFKLNSQDFELVYKKVSLMSLIIIFGLVFSFRNSILSFISGLLPRKSHIDILRNINTGKQLLILVDELDRLSRDSMSLLLNEILSIHESWKNNDINYKIVLFYDYNIVSQTMNENTKFLQMDFLQKYVNSCFYLERTSYHNDLFSIFFEHIDYYNDSINSHKSGVYLPQVSKLIIQEIDTKLYSFRDLGRFETYISDKFKLIYRLLDNGVYRVGEEEIPLALFIDCLVLTLFIEYRGRLSPNNNFKDNKYADILANIYVEYDFIEIHKSIHDRIFNQAYLESSKITNLSRMRLYE